MNIDNKIDIKPYLDPNKIFNDPSTSNWLKKAMIEASKRDPVDAVNDAEFLYNFLSVQFAKMMHGFEQEEKKRKAEKAEKRALKKKLKNAIVVKTVNKTLQ